MSQLAKEEKQMEWKREEETEKKVNN